MEARSFRKRGGSARLRRIAILIVGVAFFVAPVSIVGTTSASHPAPDVAKMSALLQPLRPSLPTLADSAPSAPYPLLGLPPTPTKPGMPGDCGTTHDAGNDAANATPLATPDDCNGTLGGGDRLDIYSVKLDAGTLLAATLAPTTANVSYELCLASPERLVLTCSANGTGDRKSTRLNSSHCFQ
jgi:hypothetical protein